MKYLKIVLVAAIAISAWSLTLPSRTGVQASGQQAKQKSTKEDKNKQAAGDKDDQAIRLGAALVTVPLAVTDKHNGYINDLTKEDMEVLEDSKPQQIFSFEKRTDLPLTMAMLIDISGSENNTLPIEVEAGSDFFNKVLRPSKDLAAVITFESEAVLLQDLTQNVSRLQAALRKVRPAVADARVGSVTGTPPINDSRVGSTALYDAVYSVSGDLLKKEAGRRVIILITDGFDTSSSLKMKDAVEAAWRNEIVIYSIGIGDPGFEGINRGVLGKMSSETGGRAFYPKSRQSLQEAFTQIDEDLRQMYILTYQPSNDARDGSFRQIAVKVKNKKDLTVRHRRGYFAPKGA
jgi:VWFA-related protein